MRVSFDTWITLEEGTDDEIEVEVSASVNRQGDVDYFKVMHEGRDITSLVPQHCFRYFEEQAIEAYYDQRDLKGE